MPNLGALLVTLGGGSTDYRQDVVQSTDTQHATVIVSLDQY